MSTNYGSDVSATTSLRTGRLVTGARLVAESAFRRLITPRGMLRGGEEEANFGLDLTELVGGVTSSAEEATIPGRVQAELLKDERIESVDVTVLRMRQGPGTRYRITIEALTNAGPFSLQVGVNDVSTELIGLKAEG
jgi:hypothetical protein